MEKIDPYNGRAQFERWMQAARTGNVDIPAASLPVVIRYVTDMSHGRNVSPSSRRGPRGYLQLNAMHHKLSYLARLADKHLGQPCLTSLTEDQIHQLVSDMRTGVLTTRQGKPYRSVGTYVKFFKAFWRWWMRVEKKAGRHVPDIVVDLDARTERPPWVYLTEDDLRALCREAKFEYRVLMLFLWDSGIRSPTELVNVRRADLSPDCRSLRIREESSKTFGRQIKLLVCHEALREYLEVKGVAPEEQVFPIKAYVANRYLQRLAKRVLGDGVSRGGAPYPRLTMYDFRHSGACYWRPRYKTEAALMYRFGWKKHDMVNYYTRFIGMEDSITEDDLYASGRAKTAVEQQLSRTERENELLKERLSQLDRQLQEVLPTVASLADRQSAVPPLRSLVDAPPS